jgi:hypothetical protein
MTTDGIIYSINKQRKSRQLNQLSHNTKIDIAAKIQAKQMASTGEFGHVLRGAKYPTLADRMRVTEYAYSNAGEVLYSGIDDTETVVQSWLNSKPHREAILHPDVEEIGISVQYSQKGRPYVCAVVCIPIGKKSDTIEDIGDEILEVVKRYGKTAGKKLLIKIAKSDYMKEIIKSPIIQKIIAILR